MERLSTMNIYEVALKSKSNKEVYYLTTTEGNIYLLPLGDTLYNFISQIMWGDQLNLKCSEVRVRKVPHLKTLNVGALIEFSWENTSIDEFLLDYTYKKHPNREWLSNIINTIIGERFRAFIMQGQQEKTDYILDKKHMKIWAFPVFIYLSQDLNSIFTHIVRIHF